MLQLIIVANFSTQKLVDTVFGSKIGLSMKLMLLIYASHDGFSKTACSFIGIILHEFDPVLFKVGLSCYTQLILHLLCWSRCYFSCFIIG